MLVNLCTRIWAGKKGTSKASEFMPFYEAPKKDPEAEAKIKQQIEVLSLLMGARPE